MDDNNKNKVQEGLLALSNENLQESSGEEKCDINPEHSKKSDTSPDEESVSDSLDCSRNKSKTCDKAIAKTADVSRSLAFTIDFDGDKVINSKKYNDIVERFQKRHRRGVSLSKLDEPIASTNPVCPSSLDKAKPPVKKFQRGSDTLEKYSNSNEPHIKLRDKSLLNSSNEAGQRHSWSPRTSVNLPQKIADNAESKDVSFKPKSTILQKTLQEIQRSKQNATNTHKSPINHQNIECVRPPLEFCKNSDDESVSEAGTYTLDGDNYTEEQKAKMCIDKIEKDSSIKVEVQDVNCFRPFKKTEYQMQNLNYCNTRQSNIEPELKILELDPVWAGEKKKKPKISYLEKIKSKVRTIGDKTFHKEITPDKLISASSLPLDIGSFTSVTASGIFSRAVQTQLPKLSRRNSLTQSQVDSSEYVQRSGLTNDKLFNSYTDYEKARHNEYKLNVFSHPGCITDAEKENSNERFAIGLEHAETKNDWIQEWAKNARRNTTGNTTKNFTTKQKKDSPLGNYEGSIYSEQFGDNLCQNYVKESDRYKDSLSDYDFRLRSTNALNRGSYDSVQPKYSPNTNPSSMHPNYRKVLNEFGVGSEFESDELSSPSERAHDSGHFFNEPIVRAKVTLRPPISPTKIPSPMHSLRRGRSCSANRESYSNNVDLDDTEKYLYKTAAAISTLQKIQRKKNSPQSVASPEAVTVSTNISSFGPQSNTINCHPSAYTSIRLQQLHKRNNSVDGIDYKPKMFNNREMSHSYDSEQMNVALSSRPHKRHNSYEDKTTTFLRSMNQNSIDQTFMPQILIRSSLSAKNSQHNSSSNKNAVAKQVQNFSQPQIKRSSSFSNKQLGNPVTKSLTPNLPSKNNYSSSIQKSASSASFKNMTSTYDAEYYLNDEDDLNLTNLCSSESDISEGDNEKEPITNTRYNKAFLIRMEQNKQKATGIQTKQGVSACPNTPELPRRENRIRTSLRDRASMPRDSSLNRMKQDIPSLNISKKVLTTKEREMNKKVQPKYMDISKYKQTQGNTFLKRDESKSTLINKDLKRSSSAFVGLNKSDLGRSSVRSVKSASSAKSSTSSANKEAELAMWRRRASYDPIKAAAEGKKKQEEARRSMQSSKYNESSIVLRSQSFHNGIGHVNNLRNDNPSDDAKHRWTLLSTESSDDEFIENY